MQYPIFLINTLDGRAPRKHLEEAKGFSHSSLEQLDVVSRGKYQGNRLVATGDLPQLVSAHGVWERQVVSWFWNSYAPSTRLAGDSDSGSVWLYHAIQISSPIPVLKQSLLALSMTRYGRVKGDFDLTKRGHQIYGNALKLLQEALYDEVLMWNDETLASVRALVLYEVGKSVLANQQFQPSNLFSSYSSRPRLMPVLGISTWQASQL